MEFLDLQQQKLLELTSPNGSMNRFIPIYNSRNYQSLLANTQLTMSCFISTIVEIIRAYQPMKNRRCKHWYLQQQKLLELTSQPCCHLDSFPYLQQQKLLELTSLVCRQMVHAINLQQQKLLELTSQRKNLKALSIYNSRNYQSLLA